MSKGQTNKHRLALEIGSPDTYLQFDKVQKWANDLPIGVVGFQVRGTSLQTILNITDTAIRFQVIEWDTDSFVVPLSVSGNTNQFYIPLELGGLYMVSFSYYNSLGINLRGYLTLELNDNRKLMTVNMSTRQIGPLEYIDLVGIVPYIFKPGDFFRIRLYQSTGATQGFNPYTLEDLGGSQAPILTFTRINPTSRLPSQIGTSKLT